MNTAPSPPATLVEAADRSGYDFASYPYEPIPLNESEVAFLEDAAKRHGFDSWEALALELVNKHPEILSDWQSDATKAAALFASIAAAYESGTDRYKAAVDSVVECSQGRRV
jgi:hypothetical protein